jgi:hypothetical protein
LDKRLYVNRWLGRFFSDESVVAQFESLLPTAGASAYRLVCDPDMRVGQVKSVFFDIVEALVYVKVGIDITLFQIERLERSPWSILCRQVPANVVAYKAEDAAPPSKNVNQHSLFSFLLRSQRVTTQQVTPNFVDRIVPNFKLRRYATNPKIAAALIAFSSSQGSIIPRTLNVHSHEN